MNRKKFFKKSVLGLGGIVALPHLFSSCHSGTSSDRNPPSGYSRGGHAADSEPWNGSGSCPTSPSETEGPFPIKTPAQLVRENIVVDRKGIPFLITFSIKSQDNDCQPLPNAIVDVWHCDADGNYSEYGDIRMQRTDYKDRHFLRGRQTTDTHGQVSFISIFPGWYTGRAPHVHVEVFDEREQSLLISQVAFEEGPVNEIYATEHYHGPADQENESDMLFANSLEGNMADSLTGNIKDGYIMLKTLIV